MGIGSGAVTAAAVLAVVAGALLLDQPATEAPVPQHPAAPATGVERAPPTGGVGYTWPTGDPVEVLRPFLPPAERWSAGHRGVDLRVAQGEPVRVAADGVVAFAGPVAGRGVVSVDHADGVRTTYEPVSAVVGRGAPVTGGQVIGQLDGIGHCAPDPCLHWGARRGPDDYIDPLGLVADEVVIRLLPQHGS